MPLPPPLATAHGGASSSSAPFSSYIPTIIIVISILALALFASVGIPLLLRYISRRRSAHNNVTSSPPAAPLNPEPLPLGLRLGADSLSDCPVCLSPMLPDQELRLLPDCRHSFHSPCIERWLATTASCPLCRSPVSVAALPPLPLILPPPSTLVRLLPGPAVRAAPSSSRLISSASSSSRHSGWLSHCSDASSAAAAASSSSRHSGWLSHCSDASSSAAAASSSSRHSGRWSHYSDASSAADASSSSSRHSGRWSHCSDASATAAAATFQHSGSRSPRHDAEYAAAAAEAEASYGGGWRRRYSGDTEVEDEGFFSF